MMYKLNKKSKAIEAFTPDAKDEFKHIVFKSATQKQLEFLFKRKHPAVLKDK